MQTRTEDEAKVEAIRYFKTMLGTPPVNHYPGLGALRPYIHKRVSPDLYTILDEIPKDADIKEALFSIHSNKGLWP